MAGQLEKALNTAIRKILKPLARMLLRNGIAYGSFAEIARRIFVEVAFEDFKNPGKKQSVSQVSALTGITRKEVSRIRDTEPDEDTEASNKYNRAIRVINGWRNNPIYTNKDGDPLTLPLNSAEPSFSSLVKSFSGDIPTKAMLDVLVKSGCVEKGEDSTVSLISPAYIPSGDPIDKIDILGNDVNELIATIDHNLTSPKEDLRFQRKVSYSSIPEKAADEFRKLARIRSQSLLEELNEWLYEHGSNSEDNSSAPEDKSLSVGIYYYEKPGEEGS